jgi:hypothetical protein
MMQEALVGMWMMLWHAHKPAVAPGHAEQHVINITWKQCALKFVRVIDQSHI